MLAIILNDDFCPGAVGPNRAIVKKGPNNIVGKQPKGILATMATAARASVLLSINHEPGAE